MIRDAIQALPRADDSSHEISVLDAEGGARRRPDFVSVTRGPGMRGNLNVGLAMAKGLAVGWQIPLVGVHHMLAHALTPRLVSALDGDGNGPADPAFPFLSLLVSGGHTLLVYCKTLTHHRVLVSTVDIAIGDMLDKAARVILPDDVLQSATRASYGALLERFAFGQVDSDKAYAYPPPQAGKDPQAPEPTTSGWPPSPPLLTVKAGSKRNAMLFSFAGLCSAVDRRITEAVDDVSREERVAISREVMRVAFDHLASRVILALQHLSRNRKTGAGSVLPIVVSGGVASNQFLRHVLRQVLSKRGYFTTTRLVYPPVDLCVDNAVMIGWTGIEMFEAGWTSALSCQSLRKWSMDSREKDGGIVNVRPRTRHEDGRMLED
ncbi:MAG: hypothetical protein M1826_007348 [Phylliscum demangeonii]|nr:MAG: hypothetical protein M1826_007348 [Phylliscum demangeonii]